MIQKQKHRTLQPLQSLLHHDPVNHSQLANIIDKALQLSILDASHVHLTVEIKYVLHLRYVKAVLDPVFGEIVFLDVVGVMEMVFCGLFCGLEVEEFGLDELVVVEVQFLLCLRRLQVMIGYVMVDGYDFGGYFRDKERYRDDGIVQCLFLL